MTCQSANCEETLLPYATQCPRGHPYDPDADLALPPIRIVRAPVPDNEQDSGQTRSRLLQLKIDDRSVVVPIDDEIVIGRGPGTAAPGLFAECPNVSREHLRVIAVESGFQLIDQSLNGTYLAGRRIDSTVISDSATVRLACNRELHLAVVSVSPDRFSR